MTSCNFITDISKEILPITRDTHNMKACVRCFSFFHQMTVHKYLFQLKIFFRSRDIQFFLFLYSFFFLSAIALEDDPR